MRDGRTPIDGGTGADTGERVLRRISRRLMPQLFVLYLLAYVDRQNISYAKLEMADALGLSEAAYGLGASLFFLGYFLFEAPSNVILARVGARVWFARILGTWGLITIALGFTRDTTMFYVLRFLLGVAEAGFFPGVLFVLTLWYPQARRARMVGWFMIASAVANAIGSLIGGALLEMGGLWGLAGWQWIFVATGIPAVLMTPVVLLTLPSRPADARFLSTADKAWLADTLAAEPAQIAEGSAWRSMIDPDVLKLAALYFAMPLGAYGLSYWLPTIVRGFGASDLQNGLLNILPWVCVALALWAVPRHAARRGASRWHIVAPMLVAAAALMGSVVLPGTAVKFACLCLAAAAVFAGQPMFWSVPQRLLSGANAAAGLAAINSIGNLGGFVAQNAVPAVRDATGSNLAPMALLSVALALSAAGFFVLLPRIEGVRSRQV